MNIEPRNNTSEIISAVGMVQLDIISPTNGATDPTDPRAEQTAPATAGADLLDTAEATPDTAAYGAAASSDARHATPAEPGDPRPAQNQRAEQDDQHHVDAEGVATLDEVDAAPTLEYGLPVHPVCNLFPLMDESRVKDLAVDIKKNGLVQPIVRHDGQLVDGRNRLRACGIAGVEPQFVELRDIYTGEMSVDSWIWSLNLQRRHLTSDQIAMAWVELEDWKMKETARQRQIEAGRQQGHRGAEGGRGHEKPLATDSVQGVSAAAPARKRDRSASTRERIAKEAGVSTNKVQQAMTVAKSKDQNLKKQVRDGKVPLAKAEKQVKGQTAAKPTKRKSENKAKGNAALPVPPPTRSSDAAAKMTSSEPAAPTPDNIEPQVEAAMQKVMPTVDAALEALGEETRDRFLKTLIGQLNAML